MHHRPPSSHQQPKWFYVTFVYEVFCELKSPSNLADFGVLYGASTSARLESLFAEKKFKKGIFACTFMALLTRGSGDTGDCVATQITASLLHFGFLNEIATFSRFVFDVALLRRQLLC